MRSTISGCRNHLSFFIGRVAKAIMCNHIVTIRVLRYPLLFEILWIYFIHATPVT